MSIRTERVASLLKEDLGDILQQEYQHKCMLTITGIRVSPDLLQAHVNLSILSIQNDTGEIFDFIKEKTPEIRKKLAGRIRHQVRRIPELHFHRDDVAEYVEKIDSLFKKIESERSSSGRAEEPGKTGRDDKSDRQNQ